jgi:arsenate reductase
MNRGYILSERRSYDMSIRFFEYAKCSTCVKARKWLESRKVSIDVTPIVEQPPRKAELLKWMRSSGIEPKKFFNTSGMSYRDGKFGEKLPKMSIVQMADALAADGKLIKRPVLVDGDTILVGFDENAYAAHFRE